MGWQHVGAFAIPAVHPIGMSKTASVGANSEIPDGSSSAAEPLRVESPTATSGGIVETVAYPIGFPKTSLSGVVSELLEESEIAAEPLRVGSPVTTSGEISEERIIDSE